MHFLYTITIYPLELLFRFAYLSCVSVTGSYGIALVALSLLVACVYVPLHRVVNKARDREQEMQDVMAPRIAKIKEKYTGAERHEATLELYRRLGYHPIMAIRSAFGILLQVPFLMAAYYMVAGLTVLEGQSFLFVKDLAKPDALLFGANLLPIVMTALNVVTTFLVPNMKLRERVQALVLAGLFLWLLYPAPSALLFYWTCNNAIYLCEAIFAIFTKKQENPKNQILGELGKFNLWEKLKNLYCEHNLNSDSFALDTAGRERVNRVTSIVTYVIFVLFFILTEKTFYEIADETREVAKLEAAYTYFYQVLVFLMLFASVRFAQWFLLTAESKGKKRKEVFCRLSLLAVVFVLFTAFMEFMIIKYRQDNILPRFTDYKFICSAVLPFVYFGCLALLAVPSKLYDKFFASRFAENSGKLYFASVLAFASVFFVYCPAGLYASDKGFFQQSFGSLIVTLLPLLLVSLALALVLYFALPRKVRVALSFVATALVAFSLLVCFVFTVDYGALDGTILQNANTLHSSVIIWKDLLAIIATAIFLFLLVTREKVQRGVLIVLVGVVMASVSYSGFLVTTAKENNDSSIAAGKNLLPPYNDQMWRLSKTEKNVVVFFFDMFTGGHIKDIVEEEPWMADGLDGFVWYPDTVTLGQCTVQSTPSLYGGPAFEPSELDKDRDGEDLLTKMNRGYYLLPNKFEEEGYEVVLAGLPYSNEEQCKKHSKMKNALVLPMPSRVWGNDYVDYWHLRMKEEKAKIRSEKVKEAMSNVDPKEVWRKYFTVLSCFRLLPHTFRTSLYQDGAWHGNLKAMSVKQAEWVIPHLAPLQFMADFVTADAKKPTFKFYQSLLSHVSWHLKPNSLIPVEDPYPETKPGEGNMGCGFTLVNGRIPEHFFTEQHMMRFVIAYCEKLKQLGCYDNTRIVIISDHGEGDSAMLNATFTGDKNKGGSPGRPHGLMLVKDFNSKGRLKTDWSLVASMDAPSFIIADLFEVPGIPTRSQIKNTIANTKRVRRHYNVRYWQPEKQNPTSYIYGSIYEITGTMFKKNNWKKIY